MNGPVERPAKPVRSNRLLDVNLHYAVARRRSSGIGCRVMTALFGVCELCAERTSKAAMMKHLALCAPKHGRASGTPCELFQLRVEGKGTAMFWLDVEVKAESPIRRLDDLLRRVWLECCGHMSAIETGGLRYLRDGRQRVRPRSDRAQHEHEGFSGSNLAGAAPIV